MKKKINIPLVILITIIFVLLFCIVGEAIIWHVVSVTGVTAP